MVANSAYVIAARRAANGRIGGLHRARRIEALAVPVIEAALGDAGLGPENVDELIVGNASAGGNPARLIALAAGLPGAVPAQTIDRQCASGLEAVVSAARSIIAGECDVVVAGGAESLSTAPWRVARPRTLYQTPRFVDINAEDGAGSAQAQWIEAAEALASSRGISRDSQDIYAARSIDRACRAAEARTFAGEIVPICVSAKEARDESLDHAVPVTRLGDLPPLLESGGTLTSGNTAALHDGAGMVVVVSERVHDRLGQPSALRLLASAACGAAPDEPGMAAVLAMRKLADKLDGIAPRDFDRLEISETSAAEVVAMRDAFGLDEERINPEGGAIARGHAYAASSAVLVARLFTALVRGNQGREERYGAVSVGAFGGMGQAAVFERA